MRPGAEAPGARVPEVVLYTRAGCHLCEDAEAVLRRVMAEAARAGRDGFELRSVDIDADPELARRYGVRVPVVAIDGVEHFEYEVPEDLLVDLIRTASRP
jgi:glutaredoxin